MKLCQFIKKFFLHPNEHDNTLEPKKIMNLWTLTFKNQDLEIKFSNNEKNRVIVLFRVQFLIQVLVNFAYFVNNQFFLKNPLVAELRIAFCLWHLICLIGENWNKKIFYKYFIAFVQLISCIATCLITYQYVQSQLMNKSCTKLALGQSVSSGLQTGVLLLSYLLVCPIWMMQGIILTLTLLLLIGLLEIIGSMYWTFYILLLLMWICFRIQEYYKRLDFYSICQQNSNLYACKNIFDKTVPNSILILSGSQDDTLQDSNLTQTKFLKLIYSNDFAMKYLQAIDETQIINKLKYIFVQSEQENEQDTYNCCLNLYDILCQKIEQFDDLFHHSQSQSSIIHKEFDISDKSEYYLCFKLDSQTTVPLDTKHSYSLKIKSHFEIRVLPCLWENKQSILVIMNDISEKIKLKHLKDLDSYKDRLLATVSHDLKTPLNGMILDINIMQNILHSQKEIDNSHIEQLCSHLDEFNQSGQLLLSMINDLLDYSQINKGQLRLIPKSFNINQTFKFINQLLIKQTKEKGVELIWKNEMDGCQSQLYTDENRLKQVLINLVANAIKFTMQGSIVITTYSQEESDTILISVRDTGCGIPEDIQQNLFRLYSTFDIDKNNQHGIGLGLTISQQLVGLLGPKSKIELDSQVGKGSTFKFIIYRVLQQSPENSMQEQDLTQKQIVPRFPSQKKLKTRKVIKKAQTYFKLESLSDEYIKILIVDDTPFNIIALSAMINQVIKNCKLYKAFNGKQAFNLYTQDYMNIIFMDVNMPEMDGYQCTQEIRKYEQQQKITQSLIIIVTAFTRVDDKLKSQKCGANDHLDKPLNMDDLKKVMIKFGII